MTHEDYNRSMDKTALIIITVVLTAIIGGIAYLALASSDKSVSGNTVSPMTEQTSQTTESTSPQGKAEEAQTETSATPQPSAATNPGIYVDYSSDVIAKTPGTKLLFFYAPWCPQCRALEADIKQAGVPSDVAIIKVDYDSNQALRQKYGVTIQTTIVKVDDSGELVEKYVAYDEPTLRAVTDALL